MEQQTIATILIDAMKAHGMTVEKLAAQSGVSDRFINMLIEERMHQLPSAPYVRGYLIALATTLSLDGEELWQTYVKHDLRIKRSGKQDELPPNRFMLPKIGRATIIGAAVLLVVVGYMIVRTVLSFDAARALTLRGLSDERTVVHESELTVSGTLEPQHQLTINQTPVYPDTTGSFSHNVVLTQGLNTLVFTVKGLLQKEDSVIRYVFYEPASTSTEPTYGTNIQE